MLKGVCSLFLICTAAGVQLHSFPSRRLYDLDNMEKQITNTGVVAVEDLAVELQNIEAAPPT